MKRHLVRAVATKTGFLYYFDTQGGSYIWSKGKLKLQHPKICRHKQQLKHNRNGGYLVLCNTTGNALGKSNRGRIFVHRGVAQAFPEICGTPNLFRNQVDHINNQMYDNRARNLQWLSPSENSAKRVRKVAVGDVNAQNAVKTVAVGNVN